MTRKKMSTRTQGKIVMVVGGFVMLASVAEGLDRSHSAQEATRLAASGEWVTATSLQVQIGDSSPTRPVSKCRVTEARATIPGRSEPLPLTFLDRSTGLSCATPGGWIDPPADSGYTATTRIWLPSDKPGTGIAEKDLIRATQGDGPEVGAIGFFLGGCFFLVGVWGTRQED